MFGADDSILSAGRTATENAAKHSADDLSAYGTSHCPCSALGHSLRNGFTTAASSEDSLPEITQPSATRLCLGRL